MDQTEASLILEAALDEFCNRPRHELVATVDATPVSREVLAASGVRYQVEIFAFWDDERGGQIRVVGNIDSFGVSAFFPLSSDRLL